MKKQYCRDCGVETWHNPIGQAETKKEQRYRCVVCGNPERRPGKNYMIRRGGKLVAEPAR